jgi:hypothetical protein
MSPVQFESVVEDNLIRIPEKYSGMVSSGTKVMVCSSDSFKEPATHRVGAGALLPDDFTAFRIDTRGFKFDREEANER